MKIQLLIKIAVVCSFLCFFFTAFAENNPKVVHTHADSGLSFIENKGQWHSNVLYKIPFNGVNAVFLEQGLFTYVYHDPKTEEELHDLPHKPLAEQTAYRLKGHAYKVYFEGANREATLLPFGKHSDYENYFIGNDPQKWASHVGLYEGVVYKNLYPSIDLRTLGQGQNFKYEFVVQPGGNTTTISLNYEGTQGMYLKNNDLVIQTSVGNIVEQRPYAYQQIGGQTIQVPCFFKLQGKKLTFDFPSGYNNNYNLIIDPVIVAATLSGSTVTNYGHCATFDNAGNIYTGARSFGAGYSVSTGAFQTSFGGGGVDIGISKYDPSGITRLYGTYIGGNSAEYPHSLIVDDYFHLYVLGSSESTNYPTVTGTYDSTLGGSVDAVVSKLSEDGADLLGSTYIGGSDSDGRNNASSNYGDQFRGEIIVDFLGNAYVAMCSQSNNFPITPGAVQSTFNSTTGATIPQDAVVFKLNTDLTSLEWSTYLGGTGLDMAFGLRLAPDNTVYVCGTAGGNNFPMVSGGIQPASAGTQDAFVVHLNQDATQMLHSTYWGTSGNEWAFFLDIDDNEEQVLIYGQSEGNMPMQPSGIYGQANGKIFVSAFNYALDNVEFSTKIGASGVGGGIGLVPVAFMVDNCGYIYISGYSASSGFQLSPDAFYSTGGFYLCVLEPQATDLNFATYYSANHVDGGTSRFDVNGIVYQGVCSGGGFDTTPTAWATDQSAGWDIGVFKIDFQTNGVNAQASALPSTSGCAPFTVDFSNIGSSALDYTWLFGDGDISNEDEPIHTYTEPGEYEVLLIASDPTSCNIADTAYLDVVIFSNTSSVIPISHCPYNGPLILDVELPLNDVQYQWADGNTLPVRTVNTDGTYVVTITHDNCFNIDSFLVDIVEAPFSLGPDTALCAESYLIDATYPNITSYAWQDGSSEATFNATATGDYYVLAIMSGCPVTDIIHIDLYEPSIVNLGTDRTACDGSSVILEPQITGDSPSYTWSDGSQQPTLVVNESGQYWLEVQTANGLCVVRDTVNVIYGNPIVDLGQDATICEGDSYTIDLTNPNWTYQWSDGASSAVRNITEAGQYTVTVNDGGCLANDSFILSVIPPPPSFDLGEFDTLCLGETVTLTVPLTEGATYRWQDGSTGNTFTVNQGGLYTLEVYSQCDTLSDSVAINYRDLPDLINPVVLPNAFSPNGDGVNDVFRPAIGTVVSDYSFYVYNRWGAKVFESTDFTEGWAGRFKGQNCDVGVYVWICRATVSDCKGTRSVDLKGNVTIVR